MRIALVVAGGVDRSGRERVIPSLLWLIERLARRHSVHVFVLRHYPKPCTYTLHGATIHDLGRATGPRGLQSLFQLPRLVRALKRARPFDVVHGYWALPPGVLAALAGRWLGIPAVATFDSGELVCLPAIGYGLQCSWRGRVAVRIVTALARVHVCTEYMERLAYGAGIEVDRLPLGIDTGDFPPPDDRPPGPPWRLLHVASLRRVKDQATLLRAFAAVVARIPDVHLDIVGEDTLGGTIQSQCDSLGLRPRVTFHGFQPTSALAAFYQRAHLLVVSSRHEAAGVVVLEAAASGLPVIGTGTGYIADWAPTAAVAVPAGSAAMLADGIIALLENPARRDALAREAARRAHACDADWTAAALERLYETMSAPS